MIDLVKFLGGSTILIAAVAWLARSLVIHALNKNAETHRELMKAQIARGSRLHEERGGVVRDIYANLVDLIGKTHSFVHPLELAGEPAKEQKQKLVAEALLKFQNHFEKNKIFLTPELCQMIQEFADSFVQPAAKFATYFQMAGGNQMTDIAKEFHDAWFSAYDKIEKDVPKARAALEKEFQAIIGIKDISNGA